MSRFAQSTFAEVKEKACKACKLEEVDVVMWDYWGDNFYGSDGPLDNFPDEKMSSGKIMDSQAIMLLEKVMAWPCLTWLLPLNTSPPDLCRYS